MKFYLHTWIVCVHFFSLFLLLAIFFFLSYVFIIVYLYYVHERIKFIRFFHLFIVIIAKVEIKKKKSNGMSKRKKEWETKKNDLNIYLMEWNQIEWNAAWRKKKWKKLVWNLKQKQKKMNAIEIENGFWFSFYYFFGVLFVISSFICECEMKVEVLKPLPPLEPPHISWHMPDLILKFFQSFEKKKFYTHTHTHIPNTHTHIFRGLAGWLLY